MLQTGLEHTESEQAFQYTLENNENVMICCGRMGPMCLPVYDIMETLTPDYPHVAFRDMDFDGPAAHVIRSLPQTAGFMGLPFTVYFKNGEVVAATSSIQSMDQVTAILDDKFTAILDDQLAVEG
jgi:thioredoxin 1